MVEVFQEHLQIYGERDRGDDNNNKLLGVNHSADCSDKPTP